MKRPAKKSGGDIKCHGKGTPRSAAKSSKSGKGGKTAKRGKASGGPEPKQPCARASTAQAKAAASKLQETAAQEQDRTKRLESVERAIQLAAECDPESLTDREQRLEEILREIAAGTWQTGPSHIQKAQEWGVALSTVQHLTAEASRVLRRIVRYDRDDDGIRAMMVAKIERIVQLALEHRVTKVERVLTKEGKAAYAAVEYVDPDFSSALRGMDLQARLMGLLKQAVEHSGPAGGPIPIEAVAVVVLPAQNQDGTPPALEAHGEEVPGNGGGVSGSGPEIETKPTNGKGKPTNGKGGDGGQ